MYSAIKKFLALHHHLSLPGIGNFSVENNAARIDIANRVINPPSEQIKFSSEKLRPEKLFYNFLGYELNVDEVQAVRSFTDFTAQLQSDIQQNKPVVLKGIGALKQSSTEIIFEPETIPEYLPVLTAERIIRKNVTHLIKVGEEERTSHEMQTVLQEKEQIILEDRWWIPALVFALLGIAGISYYYLVLHPNN
jgi:nucleoid DNA-binding protein